MLKELSTSLRRTKNECFIVTFSGYLEDGKYVGEEWSFNTLADAFSLIESKI